MPPAVSPSPHADPPVDAVSGPDLPLALTMGEPAGIGPDITLAAWQLRTSRALQPFFVVGCPLLLRERAAQLGLQVPVETIAEPAAAIEVFQRALPVYAMTEFRGVQPGRPDPRTAAGTIGAIETAVALATTGAAAAVVTNPIAKSVLYAAGFAHPGHTEFLAELAQRRTGAKVVPVMLIASDLLKVVPLTIHLPLTKVAAAVTPALLMETVRVTAAGLQVDFGIARPRIAVAGLNPHAGESGTLGDEEVRIIAPAIAALQAEGRRHSWTITGPHSADTLFHPAARARYDVAIGMYHDQVLVPAKTLAFDTGVNVTLGLPFVRTSPDHGTAFDIAGKGLASPESLIAALKLAQIMARNRQSAGGRPRVSP
jgi:4-hydroxythreonine-4-phosphate dehydrogenase